MERRTTLLKPKIDIVFHSLFRVGNEEITKAIIEAVTKEEIESISTKWKITEVSTGQKLELTDVLELYILEIPKARKVLKKEIDNELAQWMTFLDDPNKEEVSKIMENNQDIKKAMSELEEMSEDEELRRLAELREKAIKDEKNGLRHAKEEGIKQGIEQGIKQGVEQQKIEIAKEMKKQEYSNEEIQKITKLSIEQIEKI